MEAECCIYLVFYNIFDNLLRRAIDIGERINYLEAEGLPDFKGASKIFLGNVNDGVGMCKRQIFQPFCQLCLLEMKLAYGHISYKGTSIKPKKFPRRDLCTARRIQQNVLCNFQDIFLGKLFPAKIIVHRDFKDVILVSKLFASVGTSSGIYTSF